MPNLVLATAKHVRQTFAHLSEPRTSWIHSPSSSRSPDVMLCHRPDPAPYTNPRSFCFTSQFLSRLTAFVPYIPSLAYLASSLRSTSSPIPSVFIHICLAISACLVLILIRLVHTLLSLYLHCYTYASSSSIHSLSLHLYLAATYFCGIHSAPRHTYLSIHSLSSKPLTGSSEGNHPDSLITILSSLESDLQAIRQRIVHPFTGVTYHRACDVRCHCTPTPRLVLGR